MKSKITYPGGWHYETPVDRARNKLTKAWGSDKYPGTAEGYKALLASDLGNDFRAEWKACVDAGCNHGKNHG